MTALPASIAFTDSAVTEGEFKTAITNQREFLAGLLGTDGNVNTALQTLGSLGNDMVAKSSAYTVIASDRGKVIEASGTFTLSLTAAATLGDGFTFAVINTGSGIITIDPSSTEQIDGANTKAIAAGSWAIVSCNGTAFYSMGAVPATGALIGYQVFTSSGTYTKATNNPSFVIVEGTGGGGGASTSGGTTSFGTHISITGGNTNGAGGVGSNGDINSTGLQGSINISVEGNTAYGIGAPGTLYYYGSGAYEAITPSFPTTTATAQGGGASGYSKKKILNGSLSSSETVTIGAAGSGGSPAAKSGIVIVWEYK